MSTENRIHLIGTFRREEALASVLVKPGHLIEEDDDGEFRPHSTEGGAALKIVFVAICNVQTKLGRVVQITGTKTGFNALFAVRTRSCHNIYRSTAHAVDVIFSTKGYFVTE